MKISKTHLCFAYKLNNPRALENPEEFLGPNWKDVLNFWLYLDTLSLEQIVMAWERYKALDRAYGNSSLLLAWNAACEVTSEHISIEVHGATFEPNMGDASIELICVHKILEQGKSLTFVPLFLNL